jgi:hypothetical protein
MRILQQLVEFVRSPKLDKNNGRRLAVLYNATTAITLALREAGISARRTVSETFSHPSVTGVLSPFLLVRVPCTLCMQRRLRLRSGHLG